MIALWQRQLLYIIFCPHEMVFDRSRLKVHHGCPHEMVSGGSRMQVHRVIRSPTQCLNYCNVNFLNPSSVPMRGYLLKVVWYDKQVQ